MGFGSVFYVCDLETFLMPFKYPSTITFEDFVALQRRTKNDHYKAGVKSSGRDDLEEQDDIGMVDALVAISHVRISEPKRSQLCVLASPIKEQRSSVRPATFAKYVDP
nr:serine/threonine-protein kinase PEPKR2 [Tanacetum cinerariifolium]